MHIDEANLTNLTSLWKKYGSREIKGSAQALLHANTHWPHRCWPETLPGNADDCSWLESVPESAVLPVWPMMNANENGDAALLEQHLTEKRLAEKLLAKNWLCAFEQVAMYMALQERFTYLPQTRPGFQVIPVRTPEDITKWIDIGSEAFAYSIDRSVIEKLIHDEDIQILIGSQNGQAIASALLYKTGDIIGVHQVGVKQAFQGKGFARCLMLDLISDCVQWQGKYIVLQASQAGKPLYGSLGFKTQFLIKNYQKV